MQLHEFIALLEAKNLKPRQLPNGQWRSHCPAHNDAEPSLSMTESDGRILVNCFAGCSVDAICNALGITLRDLRTDQDLERRITFEIRDPNGTLVALHERIERNGKKTFVWRHPDGRKAQGDLKVADLPLYGVHKLQSADFVVIVEGEKCADALWSIGIPAVATYGATCDPADEPLRQVIERAPTVYLWGDNDDAGRKHMERLGKRLLALGATDVRWVDWHDAPEKGDAADAVAQRVDLHALLEAAKPFEPPEEAPQNGATPPTSSQTAQCPFCQLSDAELFERAKPVLDADNPLQAAVDRVSQTFGVVGENDNLQLLLLALTTRIFPQPVNVLVTGGIGQGKSYLTDAACATLPPCCHRRIVGASARALLFHPIAKGTVLQWLELPELGGDTIAATILRSILWQAPQETATDYLFVEWTPKGARRRSVQMPRQVALMTTKVDLPKDDQLLSRFLILEVRESPDKRRAVLSALAASFNGVQSNPTDDALKPVRAFAEWLARFKVRVTIPYAHALADLFAKLPPNERDYRDFATLLKLIAACALWNLAKRQHAFDGDKVTANLADYATVYRLLLPVWGKPRSAALSETERRVAEALKESDHPATAEELAKVVGITDKSVRRALKDLAEKGLAERGEKRGRAYEWRLVGDLDALTMTLPTPEAVAAAWQLSPAVTDIADIHGHDAMSAKNPINTSTFGFTDTRTQETLQMDDTDAKVTVRKIIGHFEAAPMDAERQVNRVRDVRDAKNLSGTSTFGGHSPMSANVRDVRDDRHNRDLPDPDSDLEVKVVCPRCGAWKRVPPDAFLLTDPRCPVCGEVMRLEPEGHSPMPPADPPEGDAPTVEDRGEKFSPRKGDPPDSSAPTDPADPPPADPANPTQSDPAPLTVTDLETGEPLVVGTNAWLEATFGTVCPDCGTTLTDGTCPTCGYPDDRAQWRIGRLVMAITKALRSRHPQCRSAPCDACRQVVARMNRAVVANDLRGLIALWREVTTDAL